MLHLASELVMDAVIEPGELREELSAASPTRSQSSARRRRVAGAANPVTPV